MSDQRIRADEIEAMDNPILEALKNRMQEGVFPFRKTYPCKWAHEPLLSQAQKNAPAD